MIQFKADCGHTIEVPDRDAGRVVRCAYCGREVEAPSADGPDEVLFEEVDLGELARGAGISADQSLTIQGRQRGGRASTLEQSPPTGKMGALLMTGYAVLGLVLVVLAIGAVVRFSAVEQPAEPAPQRSATTSLQDLPIATSEPPRRPPPAGQPAHAQDQRTQPPASGEQLASARQPATDDDGLEASQEDAGSGQEDDEDSEDDSEDDAGEDEQPRTPRGRSPWGSAPKTPAAAEPPPPAAAEPPPAASSRPSRRSPWERRSSAGGSAAKPAAAPALLADIVRELRTRLEQGPIQTEEWARYLCGGAQHDLWKGADATVRSDFLKLIDAQAAAGLVQPLGRTLLNESELDIRLAVLALMVATRDREVIPFIDQRLAALERGADLSAAEADRETDELNKGRAALTASPSRRSPWKRD